MDSQSRSCKRAKTAFVFCVVFNVKALLVYARIAASAAGEAAPAWLKSAHLLYYQILPLWLRGYLRAAGAFPSPALGICVTRAPAPAPSVPVFASATSGTKPTAFRTSASIFAVVSLLSFRYVRTFSRPCPMRSVL